jgi:hypothetical protein
VILHKKNRTDWVAVMPATVFLDIMRELCQ